VILEKWWNREICCTASEETGWKPISLSTNLHARQYKNLHLLVSSLENVMAAARVAISLIAPSLENGASLDVEPFHGRGDSAEHAQASEVISEETEQRLAGIGF
jgi:hypothetical protein